MLQALKTETTEQPGRLAALRSLAGRIPVPSRETSVWRRVAQGAALLVLVGGTVAVANYDKSVSLTVDGKTSTVHAFASSVGDVLRSKGISVGPHDTVSPAPSASVHDGEHLVVRYGRQLHLNLDGTEQTYWTTATTVDQALAQLGIRDDGAALSVSRDATLGRQGLDMTLTTPKEIKVKVDGKTVDQTTTAATVGVLLQQLDVTLGGEDTVSTPLDAPLTDGLALTVTRIKTVTKTVSAKIAMPVTSHKDSSMAKGTTKVLKPGHAGKQRVTWQLVYKNGKLFKKTKINVVVVAKPATQVQKVGTKVSAGSAGDPGSPGGSAASLNWAALARCESGGNPRAVNPSGYYGLYQFSLSTWHSVGGSGNPIDASSAEQTHRAEILYNRAGAGQWTCGSHLFD